MQISYFPDGCRSVLLVSWLPLSSLGVRSSLAECALLTSGLTLKPSNMKRWVPCKGHIEGRNIQIGESEAMCCVQVVDNRIPIPIVYSYNLNRLHWIEKFDFWANQKAEPLKASWPNSLYMALKQSNKLHLRAWFLQPVETLLTLFMSRNRFDYFVMKSELKNTVKWRWEKPSTVWCHPLQTDNKNTIKLMLVCTLRNGRAVFLDQTVLCNYNSAALIDVVSKLLHKNMCCSLFAVLLLPKPRWY